MSRGGFAKRDREDEQRRKQLEKQRKRSEKRGAGPREVAIVSAPQHQDVSPSVEDIMRTLERGAGGDRSAASLPARLYVGGLGDEVSENELRAAFGQYGTIADCVVMRDRDTRASRGFGFVTMADRRDAPRAIAAMHGNDSMGRTLVVNVATERAR